MSAAVAELEPEGLAEEFERLCMEYETAPDDDPSKPEAWNLLADWALENQKLVLAALKGQSTENAALVRYIQLVEAEDGVTMVPPAVIQRGKTWIAPTEPDGMTERQFQMLLEAEAEAVPERERPWLRQLIARRRHILAHHEARAMPVRR